MVMMMVMMMMVMMKTLFFRPIFPKNEMINDNAAELKANNK